MRQVRLGTTRVTEGLHVTLAGRTVRHDVALIEHVTLGSDSALAKAQRKWIYSRGQNKV